MSPTADAAQDRPADWEAPGAALVRSATTDPIPPLSQLRRVHLIGIAGSGMSALARILLDRGVDVSGCEQRESPIVDELRERGAEVRIGHALDHLDGIDAFIYSTAIPRTHPEFAAARAREGLLVLRRAAALAAALADRRTVAITGTHGKSTTSSLLTVAAQACGADPSYALGAELSDGSNGHIGGGSLAIVEADESDGSFLLTRPTAAIVTNVEADHLENWGDLDGILHGFELFVDRLETGPDAGPLLACVDDPGARRVAEYARHSGRRVIGYGADPDTDVVVSDVVTGPSSVSFSVTGRGPLARLGRRKVTVGSLVGAHMALNAAAALTMAVELGLDPDVVLESWRSFGGVHRRFELHGEAGGVRVYDDYAHHPTEVAAQLRAARDVAAPGRLIGVFQPGTFSRTQTFAAEFGQAMAIADVAVVLDIFPAREEPIPGITGATIVERIPLPAERVVYEPDFDAAAGHIAALTRSGDLVLTMGIGTVYQLCPRVLALLSGAAQAPAEAEGPGGTGGS